MYNQEPTFEFVSKDEEFSELRIFEQALKSTSEYYQTLRNNLRDRKKGIGDRAYQKELNIINQKADVAKKFASKINDAMSEYKKEVNKVNEFQNKQLDIYISSLNNGKINTVFSKEQEQIKNKKIKIRTDLLKILRDKHLKEVSTQLDVNGSLGIRNHSDQMAENFVVETSERTKGNIENIVDKLKDYKIVDQFIRRSEEEQMTSQGIPVINDKDIYSDKISTVGQTIHVAQNTLDQNNVQPDNEIQGKIQTIDSILRNNREKIADENTKKLTNTEIRNLHITVEEYKKLSDLKSECKRVESALDYINQQKIELYPNTKILLANYQKQLLEQIKKTIEKANAKSQEANLSKHLDNYEKEQNDKLVRYYESRIRFAKETNNKEEQMHYEQELEAYKNSFQTTLEKEENQRTR